MNFYIFFLNIYLEYFWVDCFLLDVFTYLFNILILYFVLLILKHMFNAICINCMA